MRHIDWKPVLDTASMAALDYLDSLADRPVLPEAADHDAILAALDRPPTAAGADAAHVIGELARDLQPYVTARASGRYFGFVVGGLHPAALGAELLVNTGSFDDFTARLNR